MALTRQGKETWRKKGTSWSESFQQNENRARGLERIINPGGEKRKNSAHLNKYGWKTLQNPQNRNIKDHWQSSGF